MWFWAYVNDDDEIEVFGFGANEKDACVQASTECPPGCTLYIGKLDKYSVLITVQRGEGK